MVIKNIITDPIHKTKLYVHVFEILDEILLVIIEYFLIRLGNCINI